MAFFNAVNVWQFTLDLAERYWKPALIIAVTPLVLFIIAAIVMFIVALILRAYEAITTYRYNIKHPCPICHEKSEPARYYVDETDEGELPCQLRPGIYGLLHVTHPVTGTRMPTLILNGRDQLLRKCPHCGQFVNFEAGTEKHIGFVGLPGSGKTTLMTSVIGQLMKRNSEMHFTDDVSQDVKDATDHVLQNGCLDNYHLPQKTQNLDINKSVQCMLPRPNGGMPYHLYFNDVAGEVFTASEYNKDVTRFCKDVENIFFIVDPTTMQLKEEQCSDALQQWLKTDDVKMLRSGELKDINMVCYSMTNMLRGNKRNLGKIHFSFVLVKNDMGYMKQVDGTNPDAVREFMLRDMRLANLIDNAESEFADVSYVAVSVFNKNDKGVSALCDTLLQQLDIAKAE